MTASCQEQVRGIPPSRPQLSGWVRRNWSTAGIDLPASAGAADSLLRSPSRRLLPRSRQAANASLPASCRYGHHTEQRVDRDGSYEDESVVEAAQQTQRCGSAPISNPPGEARPSLRRHSQRQIRYLQKSGISKYRYRHKMAPVHPIDFGCSYAGDAVVASGAAVRQFADAAARCGTARSAARPMSSKRNREGILRRRIHRCAART
ncbi:hypothetical protein ACVILK_007756 [Bradyrhizobium embrapense]